MTDKPAEGRPRLLVLTSTFPRRKGDSEPGFVFDLCRRLAGEWEVTVLAPHAAGAAAAESLDGVSVVRFRYGPEAWERLAYEGGIVANLRRNPLLAFMLPAFFLAQLLAVLGLLRGLRPAAAHAHWMVPQGIVLAAARSLGGAVPRAICTAHGSDVSALRGGFWRSARRWVARRCERIVAVSEDLKARLVAEGCPAGRIEVVPMGADLDGLFVPDGGPRNAAEILFVGRLVPGKGAALLVRALPAVLAACPGATLTLVGGGPERESLAALARRLDIAERVSFLGPLPHAALAERYRRAALLALPSLEEGFGLVLVEAMGCGCPVAASDIPSLRELLLGGQAGRLFRAGDAADLARALVELLADEAARHALGERGRAHAVARFGWRALAQRYTLLLAREGSGAGHA